MVSQWCLNGLPGVRLGSAGASGCSVSGPGGLWVAAGFPWASLAWVGATRFGAGGLLWVETGLYQGFSASDRPWGGAPAESAGRLNGVSMASQWCHNVRPANGSGLYLVGAPKNGLESHPVTGIATVNMEVCWGPVDYGSLGRHVTCQPTPTLNS